MSSLYSQSLLDLNEEIAGDGFAGGGGASVGYEMATGRPMEFAINHDEKAVAMHRANHPQTIHFRADIFEVCPFLATRGRPVGFMWFSPDCTYFSKARGGKPIRHANRKRRALAWVILRWCAQASPRVIAMENVEEFQGWGPLVAKRCPITKRVIKASDKSVAAPGERVPVQDQLLIPDPRRAGQTYKRFVRQIRELGYEIEWRELRCADYGAPTRRKRWFAVARRDGRPIVWPEASHVDPKKVGRTKRKRDEFFRANPQLSPYRLLAECVDWSYPMLSIFATKEEARAWAKLHGQGNPIRPLAENTLRRIARGVMRYVLGPTPPYLGSIGESSGLESPYVARIGQSNGNGGYVRSVGSPIDTITTKAEHMVVAPVAVSVAHGEGEGKSKRRGRGARSVEEPHSSVVGRGDVALVMPVVATNTTGHAATSIDSSAPTLCTGNQHALVAGFGVPRYGEREGREPRCLSLEASAPSVVCDGNGASLVAIHATNYHGGPGGDDRSLSVDEPGATLDTENRFGIVAAFATQNNGGFCETDARTIEDAAPTMTAKGANVSLVGITVAKLRGTSTAAPVDEAAHTLSAGGQHQALVAAYADTANLGWDNRSGRPLDDPSAAVCAQGSKQAIVAVTTEAYYGTDQAGEISEPAPTITTKDRHSVVGVHVMREFGNSVGEPVDEPGGTITAGGGGKSALVKTFLQKYEGPEGGELGERLTLDAWGNVVLKLAKRTNLNFGPLAFVEAGEYRIVDIRMRMLQPKELFLAQGFPRSYVFEWGYDADGQRIDLSKKDQVEKCGNSVPPQVAAAIIGANVPEMIVRELPNRTSVRKRANGAVSRDPGGEPCLA